MKHYDYCDAVAAQREKDVEKQGFILTPKKSDDVSEKINNAYCISLSSRQVELKNECGETVDVISDMRRLGDMRRLPQYDELVIQLGRAGMLEDVAKVEFDNVYIKGEQMYIFKPYKLTEFYLRRAYVKDPSCLGHGGEWETAANRETAKNAAYRRLEQQGAIIIKNAEYNKYKGRVEIDHAMTMREFFIDWKIRVIFQTSKDTRMIELFRDKDKDVWSVQYDDISRCGTMRVKELQAAETHSNVIEILKNHDTTLEAYPLTTETKICVYRCVKDAELVGYVYVPENW